MKRYDTLIGTDLEQAIAYLKRDEVVGIPAENVYGLTVNAFSERAVGGLFAVKQRPYHNPLIVYVDRIAEVKALVRELPPAAEMLLQYFTPGPLTLLLKKNAALPGAVTRGRMEVAIRIPAHPMALELLGKIDFPLVAPSAYGLAASRPRQARDVVKHFEGKIPYVLDGGECELGIEATVVGFEKDGTPVVYRQGAITADEIEVVAGRVRVRSAHRMDPSPHLSLRPYTPATPLCLLNRFHPLRKYELRRTGVLCFSRYYHDVPLLNQYVLSGSGNLEEAARNLYRGLHYLDSLKLDVIIAEMCPPWGLGKTINERLQRVAYPCSVIV